jgi:hypothetical protein
MLESGESSNLEVRRRSSAFAGDDGEIGERAPLDPAGCGALDDRCSREIPDKGLRNRWPNFFVLTNEGQRGNPSNLTRFAPA